MALHCVQGKPFFTAASQPQKQYEYLTKDIETEVIIVGGGISGCILGHTFAQENIPTVILEKSRIGYQSTSITTALLQYELDDLLVEMTETMKKEDVLHLYQMNQTALSMLDQYIRQYGNHCNYRKRDSLLYTAKKTDVPILKKEYEIRRDAGFTVDFITPQNNPFIFDVEGGIYSVNSSAELDPYLYAQQLAMTGVFYGLRIYENTKVDTITYEEDSVTAVTEFGYKVKGKILILATGYDTDSFSARQFGTKDLVYNIVTNPLPTLSGWYQRALIKDYNDPYNFYRTTVDDRIISGGQDVPFEEGCQKEEKAEKAYETILSNVKRIYPTKDPITIAYSFSGVFASTQDNFGFIGPDDKHERLWYCLGYGANGILNTVLGAKMLSELYQGTVNDDLKYFKIDRFDGK